MASVLLPLSVLAIQGSRPEMVYRCTVALLRVFPLVATRVFLLGMVYRCTSSAFSPFPMLAIQVFSREKVCRCTNHILRP